MQQAAAACTYSLSGTSVSLGSAGGATATNVIAASGCSWTATSNAAWITVSSGPAALATARLAVAPEKPAPLLGRAL
ncbi:MAG: hypothetical protein U5J83_12215 [Bryobacterales bacterium]|nr:hypothetical protein [Bryobacterales bacterium]